jgi:alpha-beta hydrolase superfamily lysophospholipase
MRPAMLLRWAGRIFAALSAGYIGYLSVEGSRRLLHPAFEPFAALDGAPANPGDLGLPYEEVRFRTDDGVTLSGWLIAAERETRAAVVLMHGYRWHRLPDLAEMVPWLRRRYHLLQFDFRGHGASEAALVTLGALERRDIAAAVRFLLDRGYGPIALAGMSMGGAAAILAAPELPVAAVIADAAFARLRHPVANVMRREGLPFAALGARLIVAAAAFRARVRIVDPIERVAGIAPRGLLLIAPRDDRLTHHTQSMELYRAAGDPKELYLVDGADHGGAHAVGGTAYEGRVLAFLERHLDGASASVAEPSSPLRASADQPL